MLEQQYNNRQISDSNTNTNPLPTSLSKNLQYTAIQLSQTPTNTIQIMTFNSSTQLQLQPSPQPPQHNQQNPQLQHQQQGFYNPYPSQYSIQQPNELWLNNDNITIQNQNSPQQKKVILQNPFCIYQKIDLYKYHENIQTIPQHLSIQSPSPSLQPQLLFSQHLLPQPIKQSIYKYQKNYQQFITNTQIQCIYNRHKQNITTKYNLTIYLKNIKIILQNDMLRHFQQNIYDNNIISSKIQNQQYNYCNHQIFKQSFFNSISEIQSIKSIKNNFVQKFGKSLLNNELHFKKDFIINKNILQFISNFQCGNLHFVFKARQNNHQDIPISPSPQPKIPQQTYYLFLQNDINTHGYNQWFNFLIRYHPSPTPQQPHQFSKTLLPPVLFPQNTSKYIANFIIINISKDIKYNQNMRILTYNYNSNTWQYKTKFIYYKNKYIRYNGMNYMTIQFKYQFQSLPFQDNNMIQFCLTYPYSYTKLINFLKNLKNQFQHNHKWIVDIENIGKTQANNHIYAVKIIKNKQYKTSNILQNVIFNPPQPLLTSPSPFKTQYTRPWNSSKQCVIVLARQHPSQTVSSFICQNLIRTILKQSSTPLQSQHFDWFFIPMVNPDGTIHGNSRTNLKGYDINRCWQKDTRGLSIQVDNINKFIQNIQQKQKYTINYLIDLHGHSKQMDVFCYFNQNTDKNKILNYMLTKKCKYFNYFKTKYTINYKKKKTFRAQMYYRQQIKNSITIETSLYGYLDKQTGKFIPFANHHFTQIAQSIYSVLNQYQDYKTRSRKSANSCGISSYWQKQKTILTQITQLQKQRQKNINKYHLYQNNDSDSDPQDQYLKINQRLEIGIDVKNNNNIDQQQFKNTLKNYHSQNKLYHYYPKIHNIRHEIYQKQKSLQKPIQKSLQKSSQKQQHLQKITLQKYIKQTSIISQKYNLLNNKNKLFKTTRRNIYSNSNIQLQQCKKLTQQFNLINQLDQSIKKLSFDQSYQALTKKSNQILIDKQKFKKFSLFQVKNKYLQQIKIKKINHHTFMKSQPLSSYPTASNIKIDIDKIDKISKTIYQTLYNHQKDKQQIQKKLRTLIKPKLNPKQLKSKKSSYTKLRITCKSLINPNKYIKKQLTQQQQKQFMNHTFSKFKPFHSNKTPRIISLTNQNGKIIQSI